MTSNICQQISHNHAQIISILYINSSGFGQGQLCLFLMTPTNNPISLPADMKVHLSLHSFCNTWIKGSVCFCCSLEWLSFGHPLVITRHSCSHVAMLNLSTTPVSIILDCWQNLSDICSVRAQQCLILSITSSSQELPQHTLKSRLITDAQGPRRLAQHYICICLHYSVRMKNRMPRQTKWGMFSYASLSPTATWTMSFTSHLWFPPSFFFFFYRKWSRVPGLRSDVSGRVERQKIFSQAIRTTGVNVKACPLGLNGICYVHGVVPCNKKKKKEEDEITGCVKKCPVKHQCRGGCRNRIVVKEVEPDDTCWVHHNDKLTPICEFMDLLLCSHIYFSIAILKLWPN